MRVYSCQTLDYHGYNVEFSPFSPEYLACATSRNYGFAGHGGLFLFRQSPVDGYLLAVKFEWADGLFDLSWSKTDQNFLASCSGDGAIQIWNVLSPKVPTAVLNGHVREVYGIEWSGNLNPEMMLSAAADGMIRLWDISVGAEVDAFFGHQEIVYGAYWSPHVPGFFASVAGDGDLRLWDIRAPQMPPQILPAHNGDILTCCWDTLNEHILATGGIDCTINTWDLRQPDLPISVLVGHELAVRRVKFSPFHRNILASASYDFTTRFWDLEANALIDTYSFHTEFAYGVDFNPHVPNMVADCGWDSCVKVYLDVNLDIEPLDHIT